MQQNVELSSEHLLIARDAAKQSLLLCLLLKLLREEGCGDMGGWLYRGFAAS